MYQLFVRWDTTSGYGYHRVELTFENKVLQAYLTSNTDRIYGYCEGVVETLKRMGVSINMPQCLKNRHLTPDMTQQD